MKSLWSWRRLPRPGCLTWTKGSTSCPLTSLVMLCPSPDPSSQSRAFPVPSCVHVIVGLRGGRIEEREWDAPESWVIQRWWCNCSFPSPISLSFSQCCRALFDLEAAECESLKEKSRCVLYKLLKIQVCYCGTNLHHKENQTNLLGRSHYRDSQLNTLTSSSYGFFVHTSCRYCLDLQKIR